MSSIRLRNIGSNDPDLDHSKLLDAIYKTLKYAAANGGIGLTSSKAFNRKFSHWAAENFNWEEYSAAKLLRIQKVLNEADVLPVTALHNLALNMKLGRHIKGRFQFNESALSNSENKGEFFIEVAKFYLFELDHSHLQRWPFIAPGNWDVFLNVINLEAHEVVSEAKLLDVFYGYSPEDVKADDYWDYSSFLHWHVLTPLCWIGFLEKTEAEGRWCKQQVFYAKTPLWRKCLRLDTDKDLLDISLQ